MSGAWAYFDAGALVKRYIREPRILSDGLTFARWMPFVSRRC